VQADRSIQLYPIDFKGYGGEGGIRTPGTGFSQYNGLANRRLKPLGHLSGVKDSFMSVFAASV
jgi:hypothetical protein